MWAWWLESPLTYDIDRLFYRAPTKLKKTPSGPLYLRFTFWNKSQLITVNDIISNANLKRRDVCFKTYIFSFKMSCRNNSVRGFLI